jgi:hypothetical protein
MSRYLLAAERGLVSGALVALVAAVPALLRVAPDVPSAPAAWLGIAAILVMPSALAVLVGRLARDAFDELAAGHARPVLAGIVIWLALWFPVDVVLGAVLQATTHHRGLGGATFAVLSLVVALVAALVAVRIVAVTRAILERQPRARFALLSAALVLIAFALATPMGRAMLGASWWSALPDLVRAVVVDGGIWLAAVAAATWADRPVRLPRAALALGVASLLIVGVAGFIVTHTSGAVSTAIRDRAALAGPLGQISGFI